MKTSLAFAIPEQHKPRPSSFDTAPAKVALWVEGLPLASIGESTHHVYRTLCEVNRLDIPVKERFEFLESLGSPLEVIIPALGRRLADLKLPIPEREQRISEMFVELHVELVIGYRAILADAKHGSWLNRLAMERIQATAVHRMFHFFGNILDTYQMLYEPAPQGIWGVVHQLYLQVEQLGKNQEKTVSFYTHQHATSLDQEYKQLLLMAMLKPHHLRYEQLQEVLEGMVEWTAAAELVRVDDEGHSPHAFCVQLGSDLPPAQTTGHCRQLCQVREGRRFVDTSMLMARIQRYLEGGRERIRLGSGAGIHRDTLQILLQNWDHPHSRGTERVSSNREFEVAIGLNALHAWATQLQADEQNGLSSADISLLSRQPWFEGVAMWDEIHVNSAPHKSWALAHGEEGYRQLRVPVVNESEGGYCIRLPSTGYGKLYEGEVIGLRGSEAEPWDIATVRWLHDEHNGHIQAGLQMIAAEAFPIDVKVQLKDGVSEPIQGVIAIYDEITPILILPYLPALEKKSLLLAYKGKTSPITLMERVMETAAVEAFLFNAPVMPKIEQTEDNSTPMAERFSDLWSHL